MSWDIVLFNSRQKIVSPEEVDEAQLEPTDFCSIFETHFDVIVKDDNHREIKGKDFVIDYFIDDESVSNKMLSLYGENGLFELVVLAKKHNWQIFDTGFGQMINLENPGINGYENFQNYLTQVLQQKSKMKATLENNWRHKSIENLEKQNFGNPNDAPTNMVKRCLEL